MKKSKKNSLAAAGMILVLLLAGVIFFFTYYQVDEVQVMGSSHYSEKQIKKMVLRGPLASNSVLAPLLYTKQNTKDVPFVDGYTVTRLNRHTICVSVKEKDIVGCIPYLDSYIYFDRNGVFVEGSTERNEKIPFFDGIKVKKVILNEKLPIKDETVMNTAVALSTIFSKNDKVPDHIEFGDDGQISLVYGDITVKLGKDEYLEDKMTRVLAILPLISGKKGILHAENVNDNSKTITLEQEQDESQTFAENWTGGYDEEGNYTGEGEYDENGNIRLDENGEPVEISKGGFSYGDGPMIEVYAMTQEQYDTVNGLIENTNRIMRYDQSLMEIINDEAGAFFAGEKTAEETAQLIQNRVQLYMAEQG